MDLDRNIYLKTVTLESALSIFSEKVEKLTHRRTEQVPVDECYGRITAEAVYAVQSNPNYNACAMDGIAVRSSATIDANERNRVVLLKERDFLPVDTGDVLSPPFDSVIMAEDLEVLDEDHVGIMAASHPWQHVRIIGEDIVAGEMIATGHHLIGPEDMAAFVAGGIEQVELLAKVRVAVIPTGTEIVDIGSAMKPGDIPDANSRMLAAMVMEAGGMPLRHTIVPDDRALLKSAILESVETCDIVVTIAGSSAGSEDFTVSLIRELGEVWVHGVDIKPGKPVILGAINGKPVIGIPGYPVSAYIAFRYFVVPMIHNLFRSGNICQAVNLNNQMNDSYTLLVRTVTGNSASGPVDGNIITATLTRRLVSSLKHKEFVRVQVGMVNGDITATPLTRGAGAIMSLVRANGILTVPKEVEGMEAGMQVQIELTKSNPDFEHTLMAIGSHDLLMDWLSDMFEMKDSGYHLLSAHVGSLGGIMAIKKGEAHIAPIHLLDTETGIYNIPFISRHFPDEKMVLIKGIRREQGFYTREQMPEGMDFKDIIQRGFRFINRQKGSGTRLLTDHLLHQADLTPDRLPGYDTEVLTHTGIALAVKSGNADAGIGIFSAARLMGLSYVPIGFEDYDFLIPEALLETPSIKAFLTLLDSAAFRDKLQQAGGYEMGILKYIHTGGVQS